MRWRSHGGTPALLCFAWWCCILQYTSADSNASGSAYAKPDFQLYHTKEEVFTVLEDIVASNAGIMKLETRAIADESVDPAYASSLKVVTVEPGGHTLDHSRKYRLLLNYGEHGRELITVEVALRLLQLLADPSEVLERADRPGGLGAAHLSSVLHNTVFKIIPMENERGRELVEAGNLCERKNGRGVDTNRNWEVHWGFKEKDYDPREEYPGTQPFSEPEAAELLALARGFKPHVWMNAHSGMEALFMPYDHLPRIPAGSGAAATLQVLERLNNVSCGNRCAVGSGGKSVGYLAHGTATDYMYERLKVPLSFTWEIYGDADAHFDDCFRMFNPVTRGAFDQVVADWAGAVFALLELLPAHPSLPRLPAGRLTTGRKVAAGALTSDRKLGATLPEFGSAVSGSGLGDAARLRSQLFPDVPAGRKGLIGGMIVMVIALIAMVLLVSGRAKKQRPPKKSATPAAA